MPDTLITPTKSVTLYDVENFLAAMLDTEGAVPVEMQPAFEVELADALKAAVEKRERVGQFILHCESQGKFCREEAQRITQRARTFEGVAKRLREYICGYIKGLGRDDKGKYRKLPANTLTLSVRSCPASVEITDGALVPDAFKRVSVELTLPVWKKLIEAAGSYAPDLPEVQYSIDKRALMTAIQSGQEVPGADLVLGDVALQVK